MRIVEMETEEEQREAITLLRSFPVHQRAHYTANLSTVERYFDPVAYEIEVTHLHENYGPPSGCVLLAMKGEEAVGVVCLRRLDEEACEMKRLFVPVAHHRKGIGRSLVLALLDTARERGFSVMRLDTGTFMVESQALYRTLGFVYSGPYQPVRDELRDQLVFMEIRL